MPSLLPSDISTGDIILNIMLMGVALIGVRLVSYGLKLARRMIVDSPGDPIFSEKEYREQDKRDSKFR